MRREILVRWKGVQNKAGGFVWKKKIIFCVVYVLCCAVCVWVCVRAHVCLCAFAEAFVRISAFGTPWLQPGVGQLGLQPSQLCSGQKSAEQTLPASMQFSGHQPMPLFTQGLDNKFHNLSRLNSAAAGRRMQHGIKAHSMAQPARSTQATAHTRQHTHAYAHRTVAAQGGGTLAGKPGGG